jgi:putative phosphoesterase
MNLEFDNIKKIGVISDTHIPTRAPSLPKKIFEYFNDVDLILHAGDLETSKVLNDLKKINENVVAIHGNMDPDDITSELPSKLTIKINNFKIGLIHGDGPPEGIKHRVQKEFTEKLDCIVFGHTHHPFNEIENNILFFNPGSPTDTIFTNINSIGILKINNKIKGEIIKL